MTAIARSDDVRRQNRRLVLGALRDHEQLSRTGLHRRTGLSPSTVSAITSDLIMEAILREQRDPDMPATRRGRPQVALGLNPDAAAIIAVVLSLNSLSASLIDYSGGIIVDRQARLETLGMTRRELVAAAQAMIGELVDHSARTGARVLRIAFAVQGITDSVARTMLWSPISPHSDVAFADAIEDAFGIPVTVENDCNMIAVALQARDSERYRDNFIAVLLSHGIGMGLVIKGDLFTGTRSSAGEFGHMNHVPDGALCRCGRHGCVEAYAGSYAIWRAALCHDPDETPASDVPEQEIASLAHRARERDGPERRAFDKAGEAIGFGLGSLFALIDPAPVAFVGHGAQAIDLLEDPIRRAIAKTAGGQHDAALTFLVEPNEAPLIREGCALRALTYVDREIFSGSPAQPSDARQDVA
ncbi:ROK family protein [Mesorhizobium xinjiangense]|uniref:ROK family protein n=1 Tax=Mesorhizobium xinjiangense TaxID=2678685 RepID=UPI0012EE3EC2|nr:ROK family protein [Mesorhizobium xinjiangense]